MIRLDFLLLTTESKAQVGFWETEESKSLVRKNNIVEMNFYFLWLVYNLSDWIMITEMKSI